MSGSAFPGGTMQRPIAPASSAAQPSVPGDPGAASRTSAGTLKNATTQPRSRKRYNSLEGAPSCNVGFPDGNLTIAEILAFMPEWVRSWDIIERLVNNKVNNSQTSLLARMINTFRQMPNGPLSSNSLLAVMRRSLVQSPHPHPRFRGQDPSFKMNDKQYPGYHPTANYTRGRTDLSVHTYRVPAVTHFRTLNSQAIVSSPSNDIPIADLGRGLSLWPVGEDALDLTRVVEYAQRHPNQGFMFPTDYGRVLDLVGGPLPVRPGHADQAIFNRWKMGPPDYYRVINATGVLSQSFSSSNVPVLTAPRAPPVANPKAQLPLPLGSIVAQQPPLMAKSTLGTQGQQVSWAGPASFGHPAKSHPPTMLTAARATHFLVQHVPPTQIPGDRNQENCQENSRGESDAAVAQQTSQFTRRPEKRVREECDNDPQASGSPLKRTRTEKPARLMDNPAESFHESSSSGYHSLVPPLGSSDVPETVSSPDYAGSGGRKRPSVGVLENSSHQNKKAKFTDKHDHQEPYETSPPVYPNMRHPVLESPRAQYHNDLDCSPPEDLNHFRFPVAPQLRSLQPSALDVSSQQGLQNSVIGTATIAVDVADTTPSDQGQHLPPAGPSEAFFSQPEEPATYADHLFEEFQQNHLPLNLLNGSEAAVDGSSDEVPENQRQVQALNSGDVFSATPELDSPSHRETSLATDPQMSPNTSPQQFADLSSSGHKERDGASSQFEAPEINSD